MTAARTNPVLKLLDDQKIEQIHEASYRILRELGIKVEVFMASYKGNVVLFCKSCNPNIIIRIGHPLL